MVDLIKLLDVSSPKQLKDTINQVITDTEESNARVEALAEEAKTIAEDAKEIAEGKVDAYKGAFTIDNTTRQAAGIYHNLARPGVIMPSGAGSAKVEVANKKVILSANGGSASITPQTQIQLTPGNANLQRTYSAFDPETGQEVPRTVNSNIITFAEAGCSLTASMDTTNYILTLSLVSGEGQVLSTTNIDLSWLQRDS